MIRIMFVCHGNICRSTMSEFVMKHLLKEAGLSDSVYVASSATSYEEIGSDTYYKTKAVLDKNKISYSPRRAVRLAKSDYDKYDYFIGMDDANIKNMTKILETDKKIYKLLEFAGSSKSISDPWYTDDFDLTFSDVTNGCKGLLEEIKKQII